MLHQLAPTAAAYVGLIGSHRKIRLIFESLLEAGVSEDDLKRVAAPVGLEIGSQSVPEIAISIVAELIARSQPGPADLTGRSHGRTERNVNVNVTRRLSGAKHDRGAGSRCRLQLTDGPAQAALED